MGHYAVFQGGESGYTSVPTMMPRLTATALKLAATTALTWYVVTAYLDVERFVQIIRNSHLAILSCIIPVHLAYRYVQAWQARVCLQGHGMEATTGRVFRVQLLASFYSLFLPGELAGGGVTWYLLAKDSGRRAVVANALVYLRLLNILTLLPYAAFGILAEPRLAGLGVDFYVYASAAGAAILLLPFSSKRAVERLEPCFEAVVRRLKPGRIQHATRQVLNAIHITATMPSDVVLRVVGASLATHLLSIATLGLGGLAISMALPLTAYTWLLPVVVLVHMVPITIGGLGLREVSLVVLLERIYGVDPQAALALSAIIFLVTVLFGGILGGYLALGSLGNRRSQDGSGRASAQPADRHSEGPR